MILVDENKINYSEKLLSLIDVINNLKKKVYDNILDRYQFNLKLVKNIDFPYPELKTFQEKDLFFYKSISAANFCFKPQYIIKRELYEMFKKDSNKIQVGYSKIVYKFKKDKKVNFYNNISIYDNIELKTISNNIKVMGKINSFLFEIPPIGASMDGLPFFENKKIDETQFSGWWIEGKNVKYFINNPITNEIPSVEITILYNDYK